MITLLLMLVAAGASSAGEASVTPTPEATPPINILLTRPESEPPPKGQSLSEVARHIKLKLPANQPRVITNTSVKQLAEGVELTTGVAGAPGNPTVGRPSGASDENRKTKWQQRYRSAVDRVRRLEADVKNLESQVSGLERDFYSRDDAVYRDSVIKPEWDKALADLQKARAELDAARKQPDEVVGAARHDGALPGWFRGLDQEAPTPPPAQQGVTGGQSRPPRPAPTPTRVPPKQQPGGPT
jgi:hypothetical protein